MFIIRLNKETFWLQAANQQQSKKKKDVVLKGQIINLVIYRGIEKSNHITATQFMNMHILYMYICISHFLELLRYKNCYLDSYFKIVSEYKET